MKFYWFLISTLAVWRITHLFAAEDGPFLLLARLRRAAGSGLWGTLLDCFYCLSVWTAGPVAIVAGSDWVERIFLWPALSGAAIFLNELVMKRGPETLKYYETPLPRKEEGDELLWKSENGGELRNRNTRGGE